MFAPVIIAGGLAGWAHLKATRDDQQALLARRPDIQRDVAAFREAMPRIATVDGLTEDRPALRVVLGAHDLSEDLGNTFFIRKVMTDGISAPTALANRLRDDRYKSLADDFGSAAFKLGLPGDAARIEKTAADYLVVAFEKAVGEQDADLRLALGFGRLLSGIVSQTTSPDTQWFRVMGSQPLRTVFEAAFGLPTSFAQLDIDRQKEVLMSKAEAAFGTHDLSTLAQEDNQEKVIRRFLLRRQVAETSGVNGQMVALSLVSQTAQALKASRAGG